MSSSVFLPFAFDLILGHGLGRVFVVVGKLALVLGVVRLGLLRILGRDVLKKRVNTPRRHQRISDRRK